MNLHLKIIAILLFCLPTAFAAWQLDFPPAASDMAAIQRDLNVFMMWIVTFIGIGVFGVMFYSILYHRKSKNYKAANFHENTLVEIIWTAVPILIIIAMAFPATSAILKYKDVSAPDISIKVTGYQWKWSYDYLQEGVSFYSQLSTPPEEIGGRYYGDYSQSANPQSDNYLLEVDNEVVVPVDKKVRLLFTAADVIHAWWVPQLGVKQDVVPGVVRDAWFTANREGVYRGQCAELCGKNHGFMPIVVRAVSQEDYEAWVLANGGQLAQADTTAPATQPTFASEAAAVAVAQASDTAAAGEWTMETAMAQGEAAYATYCGACHQANGEGLPPAFPGLKGAALVTGDINGHIDIVLNGKVGTAMAAFNYLSDADLAAIITYERNAWGNDTGDLVTPEDIANSR